jgi:hypothetical protein
MKLLPEFALIHDIFDGSPDAADFSLHYLRATFLGDGLVRDLRAGDWARDIEKRTRSHSPTRRKLIVEILEALRKDSRLVPAQRCLSDEPDSAVEWCREALASHARSTIDAIIAGHESAVAFSASPVVAFQDLPSFEAGLKPAASIRVPQNTAAYLVHLGPALRTARRICYFDPFLDPASPPYGELLQLLLAARDRHPLPRIELHRKCLYKGPRQPERVVTCEADWRAIFRDWDTALARSGLRALVRIWDDFHDRHFLSNVLGLQLGKGLITSRNPRAIDQWSRLSREDRDKLDREFDENNKTVHELRCGFEIGAV